MSIFESIMLICFGASWPMAIYKTYRSKNPSGKSLTFLYLILTGYLSGIFHKVFKEYNWVVFLYILNAVMVASDIVLTHWYLINSRKKSFRSNNCKQVANL
jgi:uncharacterized membrane protein